MNAMNMHANNAFTMPLLPLNSFQMKMPQRAAIIGAP